MWNESSVIVVSLGTASRHLEFSAHVLTRAEGISKSADRSMDTIVGEPRPKLVAGRVLLVNSRRKEAKTPR